MGYFGNKEYTNLDLTLGLVPLIKSTFLKEEIMPPKSHRMRIYEDYRARIQRGDISMEAKLVDTAIAAELGVSRMPVREALMQLTHEGYLKGSSRGFTLPNLTHTQILEVFELRRLLEPRAAASATHVMPREAIGRLNEAVEVSASTLENENIDVFFRASELFRNTWLHAVPNQELRKTILRYISQVQTVRVATMLDPSIHKVIVKGQKDLLDAFERRDSLAAADRMLSFVVQAEDSYSRTISERGNGAE